MNTNTLKKFAQEARKKLITQIGSRLNYVLNTDSVVLRAKATQIKSLKDAIAASSVANVIDQVAYTWFNRLVALRFMDANDYQPLGIKIVSPRQGFTLPEILQEAKQGILPAELTEPGKSLIDAAHVQDILNEKTPSQNPQNDAYKELLIAACNHLSRVFPFLFERIEDFSELLLPDDLTSPMAILQDIREGMSEADCQEVELIGWLYQFYISEKKDEVFASKKAVKKEDIPAATQLFTPRWIVEYMVQNTVGKLWLQNRPNSGLRAHMPYFIESASVQADDYLKINSVEDITLLDQACGSGHILIYGFELLSKIYEEEGYNATDIPRLILEKNLFGFEIDDRAAQLAGFALMMKARGYHRRFFRNHSKPNILCYRDLTLSQEDWTDAFGQMGLVISDELNHDLTQMQQATNYGSLIAPRTATQALEKVLALMAGKENAADAFLKYQLEQLKPTIERLLLLSHKYHCIADNPPYMGGGNMNKPLGDFVKTHYPDSKADLMACFMEAGLRMLHPRGFLGMINQHSWMFLSSYEKLREKLIKDTFFDTLLHLGPRTFPEIGGEVVQNASFTCWNTTHQAKGTYLRLVDLGSTDQKREKTIEAIQNPNCGWLYKADQKDFEKIPGSPIGYWLSEKINNSFEESKSLEEFCDLAKGMDTSNNEQFIRQWFECSENNTRFLLVDFKETMQNVKWIPYKKGGAFRKWYGNKDYVINWENNGVDVKNFKKSNIRNQRFYFKRSLSWTLLSSSFFGIRYYEEGCIFDANGSTLFVESKDDLLTLLGLLGSKFAFGILQIINPTLAFQKGDLSKIPVHQNIFNSDLKVIVEEIISISRMEWNSREVSWDFKVNELIKQRGQDLEESFDLFTSFWNKKFFMMAAKEEEINKIVSNAYGLQDELTPDVPLEDITILKEETSIQSGQLVFDTTEVFSQFMSYAVGCMFGRYSLEKEGLILANQGETLEDYFKLVDGVMVDSGRNGKIIEDGNSIGLQRTSDLASINGAGEGGLFINEKNAQGRDLRLDQSNKEGVGEYSEQYSRGAGEGNERISALSEDSPRIALRIGDANDANSEPRNVGENSSGSVPTTNSEHKAADSRFIQQAKLTTNHQPLSTKNHFLPDADNIIPILDDEWFEDDIVGRFKEFLKASFGAANFDKNLAFVEECLGKDIRKYFVKDFYNDHIKRYKKRPIYWMFSSPKGSFNVLIYLHRYTPDTLNRILNGYLVEYRAKLNNHLEQLNSSIVSGSSVEITRAEREKDRVKLVLIELQEYERSTLYPLATERIAIDLDDGVLVNYNKFGKAIKEVAGLNDAKTKQKVKEFDWIDNTQIR